MSRRSHHGWQWRFRSDYLGAGSFAACGDVILLNTEYGVQALERSGQERWRAELGSRCLGVQAFQSPHRSGAQAVATCLDGLYVLDGAGHRDWGTHSKKEIIHDPVLYGDGVILCTVHSLHYLKDWQGVEWRFDLREVLGHSVKSVRIVDAFELDECLIVAAVDYDSGIGRVLVLDVNGQKRWQSDPAPLSGLFPAGSGVFVWCASGYGRFESRLVRPDGKEIWKVDFAGTGAVHPDGSIAMLVGSNESPTWDNWEYRRLSPTGKVEAQCPARGLCAARPVLASDGALYFTGYSRVMDPASSRSEYTSFSPLPATLAFAHKTGVNVQPPQYRLSFQRATPAGEVELLGEEPDSLSFSRPLELDDVVVFTSGGDLIGFPKMRASSGGGASE